MSQFVFVICTLLGIAVLIVLLWSVANGLGVLWRHPFDPSDAQLDRYGSSSHAAGSRPGNRPAAVVPVVVSSRPARAADSDSSQSHDRPTHILADETAHTSRRAGNTERARSLPIPVDLVCCIPLTERERTNLKAAYESELLQWSLGNRPMPDLMLDEFIGNCRYVLRRRPIPIYDRHVQPVLAFCERNDFPWLALYIIDAGARRAARQRERRNRA